MENEYKIVVPIFGAAYAAPNKGTTILYWFRSLSTVLSPTENSRIQGFFKALSDFPVLFKADIIFMDFSSQPSKFKYFSSLCEPWNTNKIYIRIPQSMVHHSDFIWDYGKLPFPTHLGKYFIKIGKIRAKIHEIGKIKAIFGLGMTPIYGLKNGLIKSLHHHKYPGFILMI